jgi:hypothetical protein
VSTDKSNPDSVRLQVLLDKKSGRVFAAGPVGVQATGEDAPQEFRLIPGDGEAREEIKLTREQALMSPWDLFASHVVRKGRLVAVEKGK